MPGEAQRITLMEADETIRSPAAPGADAPRTDRYGQRRGQTPVYREVAAISTVAEDASLQRRALHSPQTTGFQGGGRIRVRRGAATTARQKLAQVEEGMWINLKHAGSTAITVRHHDGTIKALEEARDSRIIPNLQGLND